MYGDREVIGGLSVGATFDTNAEVAEPKREQCLYVLSALRFACLDPQFANVHAVSALFVFFASQFHRRLSSGCPT